MCQPFETPGGTCTPKLFGGLVGPWHVVHSAPGHAVARGAAEHELLVHAALVALERRVAGGVTVLAARVLEHAAHGLERRQARGFAADRATSRGRRCGPSGRLVPRTRRGRRRGRERGIAWVSSCLGAPGRRNGSVRSRCLVSANTALATAGAIGAVAGSPMPPILALLGMMMDGDLRHLEHAQRSDSRGSCSPGRAALGDVDLAVEAQR